MTNCMRGNSGTLQLKLSRDLPKKRFILVERWIGKEWSIFAQFVIERNTNNLVDILSGSGCENDGIVSLARFGTLLKFTIANNEPAAVFTPEFEEVTSLKMNGLR